MLLFLLFFHNTDRLLDFDASQIPKNVDDFLCMGNEGVMGEHNPTVSPVSELEEDKQDILL